MDSDDHYELTRKNQERITRLEVSTNEGFKRNDDTHHLLISEVSKVQTKTDALLREMIAYKNTIRGIGLTLAFFGMLIGWAIHEWQVFKEWFK